MTARDRSKEHKVNKSEWETPYEIYRIVHQTFGCRFGLDVAASKANSRCVRYIDKEQNALESPWFDEQAAAIGLDLWWCNPPYDQKEEFLKKAHAEYQRGNEGVMLLPASFEAFWFRQMITEPNIPRMVYPRRIEFLDPDTRKPGSGNTGGSVFIAFIKDRPLPRIVGQPWLTNALDYDPVTLMCL